jgi:hypothetical protein
MVLKNFTRSLARYSEIPTQNNIWIAMDFTFRESQIKIDLVVVPIDGVTPKIFLHQLDRERNLATAKPN